MLEKVYQLEMTHPLYFPRETKEHLRESINEALLRVDFSNYGNEPNFTPAMIQQLHGFEYEDDSVHVKFQGVVVTSVGRGSAERWSGADFSVVTLISLPNEDVVSKATLVQAKLGKVESLPPSKRDRLLEQVLDMRALMQHPKVLEIYPRGEQLPTIVSGRGILERRNLQHPTFGDWIAKRVLPTFDGDTRPEFVRAVLDAKLSSLRILARKKELRG
ncbi:MAG: hypothetical protein ICV60_02915 [Pyrinomonadaceae bacterium]|nr:hypothetical protein [Pyrinomonadaceae bacterium]